MVRQMQKLLERINEAANEITNIKCIIRLPWRDARRHTGCTQKNGVVSKVDKVCIYFPTWASAVETVHVSHALPAVRFSCSLQGRGNSFPDAVAAGEGFPCAPFRGVQICDYSAT
jgi:hypothetical protein